MEFNCDIITIEQVRLQCIIEANKTLEPEYKYRENWYPANRINALLTAAKKLEEYVIKNKK